MSYRDSPVVALGADSSRRAVEFINMLMNMAARCQRGLAASSSVLRQAFLAGFAEIVSQGKPAMVAGAGPCKPSPARHRGRGTSFVIRLINESLIQGTRMSDQQRQLGMHMTDKIDYRNLPYLLLKARETVLAQFRPIISHFGLTEQQWRVMRFLSDAGAAEQREVASACGMLGPSLAGVLARMEDMGLIDRTRLDLDQRRVSVRLSVLGEKTVQALKPLIQRQYRNMEDALGTALVTELVDVIDRFIEADHAGIEQVLLPPLDAVDPDVAQLAGPRRG